MDVRTIIINELLEHLALDIDLPTIDINKNFSLTFGKNIFAIEWYENSFRLVMYCSEFSTSAEYSKKFDFKILENVLEKINPQETQPFLIDIGSSVEFLIILSIELALYGRTNTATADAFDLLWELSEKI